MSKVEIHRGRTLPADPNVYANRDQGGIAAPPVEAEPCSGESLGRAVPVVAKLCHELRTPMNAILGFTEVLSDEFEGTGNVQTIRSAIDTIQSNGRYLLALINDVLDIAKMEAGQPSIRRERFSPRDLLRDVGASLAGRARAKGLDWKVVVDAGVPQCVVGDAVRTRQVLLNLAVNAVKFTERGLVRIEASARRRQGVGYLQLTVIDTGVGLTAEQQARIFQPFVQVATASHHREAGVGLGLAISKSLAAQMAGTLTVSSIPGRGSRFVFEIPVAGNCDGSETKVEGRPNTPSVNGRDNHAADKVLEGLRVLIADDTADNRLLLERVSQLAGAEVTVVTNGVAAVTAAINAHRSGNFFDCVLMDIHMPKVDGCEAMRRLRDLGCNAPIIAISAATMPGDREAFLLAGFDEYVSRPIDRQLLLGTVRSVVKARHTEGTAVIS